MTGAVFIAKPLTTTAKNAVTTPIALFAAP
jgi:hypothetical protein